MRKIIVREFITLDGVIQAPGGPELEQIVRDPGFVRLHNVPGRAHAPRNLTSISTFD
jgi:hypothetical protein